MPAHIHTEPPTPWLHYLRELCKRLLVVAAAVVAGTFLGYLTVRLNDYALLEWITRRHLPSGVRLQSEPPLHAVPHVLRLAGAIGIASAMPVLVYQLLAFMAPSPGGRTRRHIMTSVALLMLCFVGGLGFAWRVTVPAALTFLLDQGASRVLIQPTAASFLSLFGRLMLLNGLIFGLPVVVWALVGLGVPRGALARKRRIALLVITGVCALLIPTSDPVNLALVVVPTYLLYEGGLVLARFVPSRRSVQVP